MIPALRASGGAATTLVSSIVELARSPGLDVVAEGVETEEQRPVLRAVECGRAQGCFFARPEPAERAGARLGVPVR